MNLVELNVDLWVLHPHLDSYKGLRKNRMKREGKLNYFHLLVFLFENEEKGLFEMKEHASSEA